MANRRIFSFAIGASVAAAAALACTDQGDIPGPGDSSASPPATALSPVASAQVPHSIASSVSLVDDVTACTIDSFDVRVRCVSQDGSTVGLVGREGDGPGELRNPSSVVRGPGGTVGVVDGRLRRFQVFRPTGELVLNVPLPVPPLWVPRSFFGDTLLGTYSEAGDVAMFSSSLVAAAVSMSSGEIVEEWRPANIPEERECGPVLFGFPSGSGTWVFVDCMGRLSFVDGTGDIKTVRAPWFEELPNERDLAYFVDRTKRMRQSFARRRADMYRQRGRTPPGPSRSVEIDSDELEEYRATPKSYYLLRGQETIDDQDRLWISTHRDRAEYSYVDVFSLDAQYVGTVRVAGRMVDFDVLGKTLIVLVEGADLAASRQIDWYEIPSAFGGSGTDRVQ